MRNLSKRMQYRKDHRSKGLKGYRKFEIKMQSKCRVLQGIVMHLKSYFVLKELNLLNSYETMLEKYSRNFACIAHMLLYNFYVKSFCGIIL